MWQVNNTNLQMDTFNNILSQWLFTSFTYILVWYIYIYIYIYTHTHTHTHTFYLLLGWWPISFQLQVNVTDLSTVVFFNSCFLLQPKGHQEPRNEGSTKSVGLASKPEWVSTRSLSSHGRSPRSTSKKHR